MRAPFLLAAAAALVLVTGAAAHAAKGVLRDKAVVADTVSELDMAIEFIMDSDWEAYEELAKGGTVAIMPATADILWAEIPWDDNNVKVRMRGMKAWAYTRKYNLQEGTY